MANIFLILPDVMAGFNGTLQLLCVYYIDVVGYLSRRESWFVVNEILSCLFCRLH